MKTKARSARSAWIMAILVMAVFVGLWLAQVISFVPVVIAVLGLSWGCVMYTRKLKS